MRIAISGALSVLEHDNTVTENMKTSLQNVQSVLDGCIDPTMLISQSYVATADLIHQVLVPAAYSLYYLLMDRTEANTTYSMQLGTLSGTEIWDMEIIDSCYERFSQSFQELSALRDAAIANPEEYAMLSAACDEAEKAMFYWGTRKAIFERFIQSTNDIYTCLDYSIQPLWGPLHNAKFTWDLGEWNVGKWLINGVTVPDFLNNNEMFSKTAVVTAFEQIHPEIAAEMKALHDKAKEGVFTDENWMELRYTIYTAPAMLRDIYVANSKDIEAIYYDPDKEVSSYSAHSATITMTSIDDANDFVSTILHEMAHSIDWSIIDKSLDAASMESVDVFPAGERDVLNLYYKTALDVVTRNQKILQDTLKTPVVLGEWTNSLTAFLYTQLIRDSSSDIGKRTLTKALLKVDPCFAESVAVYQILYGHNRPISDVSGAASGSVLNGIYVHKQSYWDTSRYFWTSSEMNVEGFADYMETMMGGDYYQVYRFRENMPESTQIYDQVINMAHDYYNPVTAAAQLD